jgi:hypothetical protein
MTRRGHATGDAAPHPKGESISHLSGDPLGGRIAGDADREQGFELILTAKERAMRSQVELHSEAVAKTVREIRRATRRQYSTEEKVRIVIAGLRGEDSIAELCRKEGTLLNLASSGPLENFFHRVSQPEDVAAAILFLCFPGNRQITGQTIHTSAGAVV